MAGNPTSPEEIRRIFNDDIRPYYFPNTQTPATRPAIVLVGGQPGSGKSLSTSRIIKERPGLVPLSGDDLRSFHPDYERLMKADPLTAGKPLSEATAVWVRNAIEYARDHQHSLMLEGTFHTPQLSLDTAAQYKRAGFTTELIAVATPRMDSLLSATGRYFNSHQAAREPRWTSLTAHDRGFAGTREILSMIDASGPIDTVTVLNRTGTLYRADIDDYDAAAATAALDEGRTAPVTNRAAAGWLAELRAFTLYARATGQLNAVTVPVLDELHTIALRTVVPSMNLPEGSEAAARLTERLIQTQDELHRLSAPAAHVEYAAPPLTVDTPGPSLR